MKRLVLTLALIGMAGSAVAQSRPSAPSLSCQRVRGIVASQGAAVIGTGGYTYDRFVRDRSFCLINEYIEPVWTATANSPRCFIGYRCRDGELDFF